MRQKTAAIVVIGNEILSGKSPDKNASFLIAELYQLGVALRRIVIIPDDLDQIAQAVRECASNFDYVFTSGGVGPTHDDMTIAGVARAFDRRVIRHPQLEAMLRSYFGDGIDEARLRLADIPEDASLLHDNGVRWPVLQSSANRAGGADPRRIDEVPEDIRRGVDLVRWRGPSGPDVRPRDGLRDHAQQPSERRRAVARDSFAIHARSGQAAGRSGRQGVCLRRLRRAHARVRSVRASGQGRRRAAAARA